ncbi:Vgb family protein [Herbiconiux sp. YIM B11900]|uniref:Vgb family protein n=1 Tax=Herbiconiux sp. YIM B11900 TaxID=3404131 RepID=UPI003F85FFA0
MSIPLGTVAVHPVAEAAEGPYAVAVTPDGAVWCTLVHAGAVLRLPPASGALQRLELGAVDAGSPQHAHHSRAQPSQLAVADETSVWVTDTTGGRVLLLGPDAAGEASVKLEVAAPTAGAEPYGITVQHDGTVWFTELGQDALGRIDILGAVTEFGSGTDEGFVSMIASAGDSLWFTANQANAIGYVRGGDSAPVLFEIPTPHAGPVGITTAPDGSAWFVEILAGKVGRVDRNGRFTEHPLPWSEGKPHAIVPDPREAGGFWFTLWGANQLGHITPSGSIEVLDLSDEHSEPHGLAVAPDGTVWVAMESGALAAITPR